MYNSNEYLGLLSALSTFLIFGFVVAYVILLSSVYTYANRLGRDGGVWLFFSLLFSPLLGAFALWLKGETDEHRKERLIQEKEWLMSVGNGDDKKETTTCTDEIISERCDKEK
uniref:hypothetical protein n=1 Tax=Bacteroides clarus TaxID=626929 RepID=UPI003FF0DF25